MNMTYEFMHIKRYKYKLFPLWNNVWEPQLQKTC